MKLSLDNVLKAYVSIRNIENEKASPKWSYGIVKNRGLMQNDIDGIANSEKNIMVVDQERLKYCSDHSEKDNSGKPIIENGNYRGIDNSDVGLIEIVGRLEKEKADHNELLKSEVDIDFHMIDFCDVPEKISPADYKNLSIMINEPQK